MTELKSKYKYKPLTDEEAKALYWQGRRELANSKPESAPEQDKETIEICDIPEIYPG